MLRALVACITLLAASALHAQTIHVRVLDGKTGKSIPGVYLEIRNDERNAAMTLTADGLDMDVAKLQVLEIDGLGTKPHGKVDYYVCDVHMFEPRVDKIVANGISSMNDCGDLKQIAKPGELIIFVHRLSWIDRANRNTAIPQG